MADVRAELTRLYDQHRNLRFPRGLRAVNVAGHCMVMLDADTAGCVHTWLKCDGDITEETIAYAAVCLHKLHRVVPIFADPASDRYRPYAAHYFGRLLKMVRLITLEVAAEVVSP